jgi:hypothetical protein
MAVPYGLLTIMMMITTAREVSALISVVSSPSLRTRGSASSASRRQYFTTKLFNNVNINQSKSSAMPTILNPISKRKIHIGGPKYTELIKEGGWVQHHGTLERIDFKMLSLHQQRGSSSLTNEDKKTDLSLVESFTQPTSVDNENEIGDEWYSITPSVLRASSTSTNATKDTTESAVVMDEKNTEQLRRDLLFVNKPSGLHCVPSRALSDSLAAQIMLSYPGGKPCHRLDRDTSGIVLFGLTKEGHRDVSMQFEARTTSKTYVALVSGHPDKERGLVNLPIGKRKTEEGFNRWTIGGEKPRESITEWIVGKRQKLLEIVFTLNVAIDRQNDAAL